jgi:predicted DNA-binding transcriptional regulator AlpA
MAIVKDIHLVMREDGSGRWTAMTDGEPSIRAAGASRERCLASLRRSIERRVGKSPDGLALIVEVLPRLAGVAEAAEITGWDKRRVVTYIDRGTFPEPVQTLASGRVWLEADVKRYAEEWRARRRR